MDYIYEHISESGLRIIFNIAKNWDQNALQTPSHGNAICKAAFVYNYLFSMHFAPKHLNFSLQLLNVPFFLQSAV